MRLPALLLAPLLVLPAAAGAQIGPQLVNGLGELGEPSSVALVQGTPEDGFLVCSGVLIGCDSVITTAHCFNVNASLKTHIYVPHAGFFPIESATRHPAYVDALAQQPPGWIETTREDDISFVKLAEPVLGVTPATLAWSGAPVVGEAGFVVGFGRDPITETSLQNPGLKRSGSMQLAACADPSLIGLDVLCWSPSSPLPEPGEEVSTCTGDSGGPLFTGSASERVVSGITKGAILDPQGQPDPCLPPVSPYDVNVHRHVDWIGGSDGAGGMVAATSAVPLAVKQCGPVGQLPETLTAPPACDGSPWSAGESARTCGFQATLGGPWPSEVRYGFEVPPGTSLLRVGLNGIASSVGAVDTDLYLRAGQFAQVEANDCAAVGAGTLGFCELEAPAAQTWHLLITQALGEGEHQVVVTLLGPPPGVPGLRPAAAAAGIVLVAFAAAVSSRRRRAAA